MLLLLLLLMVGVAEGTGRWAMRYAGPVAMPAGLGEWLGAELEARGVEAASLYARAVLSILLHADAGADSCAAASSAAAAAAAAAAASSAAAVAADVDDGDHIDVDDLLHRRQALQLELRLDRHLKDQVCHPHGLVDDLETDWNRVLLGFTGFF